MSGVLDGFMELLYVAFGFLNLYLPFVLIGIFLAGIGIIIGALAIRAGIGGKIRGALGSLI